MTIQEKLQFLHNTPVISWHEHVYFKAGTKEVDVAQLENHLRVMDAMGIDRIVVSRPLGQYRQCTPEQCFDVNNLVYEAVKLHPDRLSGMAFINPGYHDAAMTELDRCVNDLGFVGVKLYHHYFMDDPVQFALTEKCIDLDIPILIHAGHVTDPETTKMQPRISDGVHMANIAKRYPEATFIMGHIGGGGDWQWSIKAMADTPNVYADMGGSVHDRPLIEESVKYLGANRILFATDGAWESGIAKILGADISDEDKKTILAGGDLRHFLDRSPK